MQDRPTVHELLDIVQHFLNTEIVPNSEGRRQFLARVAANIIRIVDRDIAYQEEHLAAERRRLDELLGPEDLSENRRHLLEAIRRRTEVICDQIRSGRADSGPYREKLVAHVRETVREKLIVANPAWLTH